MKNMKKWLPLLLALSLAVSTTACGGAGSDANTGSSADRSGNPASSPAGDTDGQAFDSASSDSGTQASESGPSDADTQAQGAEASGAEARIPDDSRADAGASRAETALHQQTVYPVTLTDQLGREVTLRKEPATIVSGYYISTSLLLALGCRDRIVGVEAKAESRALYHLSAPSLIELPNVGSAKEFDLEGCAALHPDLVVVPARLKDSIPALEELGLNVLAVNPEDQELLIQAALLLGTATNTLSAADSLIRFQEEQLAFCESVLAGTDSPSVYLSSNSSLLSAAGCEMYQNTLIRNAGGINAAAELTGDYWGEISYEQLLAWDPQYIILASDASYTVESVLSDPSLARCQAVKDGHVYRLPDAIEAWDSPVPGSVLGSLWLACVLHPEQYPDTQWKETAASFYETFYGFTPDLENLYAVE